MEILNIIFDITFTYYSSVSVIFIDVKVYDELKYTFLCLSLIDE